MMNRLYVRLAAVLLWGASALVAGVEARAAEMVKREVLAFYDSELVTNPKYSRTHRFLEMPLNRLGFVVRYHDIRAELPELSDEVYAVVAWFPEQSVDNSEAFLEWLSASLRRGKKLLWLGHGGIDHEYLGTSSGLHAYNAILRQLGAEFSGESVGLTYNSHVAYQDPEMMGFERQVGGVLKPYPVMKNQGQQCPKATY